MCVSSDKRDNKCPEHKMDLALSLETPSVQESREIQSDLKTSLAKLYQDTQENWIKLPPTALLCMQLASRDKSKYI